MERHVLAKAQRSLRPELYARITEKLVFNRLSYDVQMEIARLHIARECPFFATKASTSHSVIPLFHSSCNAAFIRDSARVRCAIRLKSICAVLLLTLCSATFARANLNSPFAETRWHCGPARSWR